MSHRIHGNHHAHNHKHKLTEQEWLENMRSRGYEIEEIQVHHPHHDSYIHKYRVFDVSNGKVLLNVDEHGHVSQ
jgi:hypothetical protein